LWPTGEPTYAIIAARSADIEVVILPRASSTQPLDLGTDASRRDVDVHTVSALGRLGWQEVTGYGRRALVETTIGRYKAVIGTRLRARNEASCRTEAAVGAAVPNRMLAAGGPSSVRSARGAARDRGHRGLLVLSPQRNNASPHRIGASDSQITPPWCLPRTASMPDLHAGTSSQLSHLKYPIAPRPARL
jgi:hypothetical protein